MPSFKVMIAALCTAAAGCTSTPPAPVAAIDPVERVRAEAALDVFQELAMQEEWYIMRFRGERAGHLERTRTVRNGEIRIVTTLVSDIERVSAFTLTEHFDAGAPHDATLLEMRSADDNRSRIVRTADGYVAETIVDGATDRQPLFDFRFRLADLLAAEVWVRDGAQVGDCLTYPDYSLSDHERLFARECIVGEDTFRFDDDSIDAVLTRRNAEPMQRSRDTGMQLASRPARGLQLRLAPRAIATRRGPATGLYDASAH